MLIQIGGNSATVTPFGSVGYSDGDGTPNARTVRYRPSVIKLALRWILNLFQAVWATPAVKRHE